MEKTQTTQLKKVTIPGGSNNNIGALQMAQNYLKEHELYKQDIQVTTSRNSYGVMTVTIHYFEVVPVE